MLTPFFTIMLLLFSSSCFGSVTETREIEVVKPKYQVPMSTVEGYAKAKLVRKISVERIRYVWASPTAISSEQKKFLERRILKISNDDFELAGLTLKATSFRNGSYFFKFEYEPPAKKMVHLSESDLSIVIQRLDTKTRSEYLIPLTNIMLANDTLFSDKSLRDHWVNVLPNSSYEALFLKRVKDFPAIKFIGKYLTEEQLPKQLSEALKLFDLAPFNKKICEKVVKLLPEDTQVFADMLKDHCSSLPTIALGRNILNVDGLKSEKTIKLVGLKNKKLENEIKTLTNVEGVRIVDRPLLLSMLTMPKKYQFDDTAFFGDTPSSNASVECFDRKILSNSTFGVKKLTDNDIAVFMEFLNAKNLIELKTAFSKRVGHFTNELKVNKEHCLTPPESKISPIKDHNNRQFGVF